MSKRLEDATRRLERSVALLESAAESRVLAEKQGTAQRTSELARLRDVNRQVSARLEAVARRLKRIVES
ncbi:MAG: hypothetical protein ACREGL_06530 [Alphaproteobacteria bacterium]